MFTGALQKIILGQLLKTHRKTPVPAPLFNKVISTQPVVLSKNSLLHRYFSLNLAKIYRSFLCRGPSNAFEQQQQQQKKRRVEKLRI